MSVQEQSLAIDGTTTRTPKSVTTKYMNNTGRLTIENPHQRQLLVRCYAHLTEADHCQILSTELTVIGYDAVHIALVDRAQQEA
jgi:hypothetical protein